MERISVIILSLTLCLVLKSNLTSALNVRSIPVPEKQSNNNGEPNPLIEKACANAKNKDQCIKTLNSCKDSSVASMKDLGFNYLNVTRILSSQMYDTIDKLMDKDEDKIKSDTIDDAYVECSDQYDDASSQIDNSIVSFFGKKMKQVNTYMNVAINNADTCQKELKKANAEDKLGDKNQVFAEQCANALAVVNAMEIKQ